MAIIKRRDQFVLFRLSKDEYDALRRLCEQRAAASISSFARSEILKILDQEKSEPDISQRLSTLQSSVGHIVELLEGMTNAKDQPRRRRLQRTS